MTSSAFCVIYQQDNNKSNNAQNTHENKGRNSNSNEKKNNENSRFVAAVLIVESRIKTGTKMSRDSSNKMRITK